MFVRKILYYVFAFGPIVFLGYLFATDAWQMSKHLGEAGNPIAMPYEAYFGFYGLLIISWLLFIVAAKITSKRFRRRGAFVITAITMAAIIPIVVGYLINTYSKVDLGVLAAIIPYAILVLIISFILPLRKRYY